MKKFITAIIVLAVVIGGYFLWSSNEVNDYGLTDEEQEMILQDSQLSLRDFSIKAKSGEYTILDVRTPEEIAEYKPFADAVELDFYEEDFEDKIKAYDREGKYLVYCMSGGRSGQAVLLMNKLGFTEVFDLAGGIINAR